MQMRPQLQIQSVLKAMTDVVLPALDPHNKLAQEQIRLCMGLLGLMAKQLPLQFQFDCDELARLTRFAGELGSMATGGAQTLGAVAELAERSRTAADVLERARATPAQIENEVRQLRAATGAVVTQVFRDGDARAQERVQRAMLAMSRDQLLRERAWVISQGWEPDPSAVPAIESLLSSGAAH